MNEADTYPNWPSWWYGPGGQAAIFERAEDVPDGWRSHPGKVEEIVEPEPEPQPEPEPEPEQAPRRRGRPPKARAEDF